MCHFSLPAALREPLATYRLRRRRHERWLASIADQPAQPGDLWTAETARLRATVLVAAVSGPDHVDVVVTHSTAEFATGLDLIADPATPGPGWTTVACGELYATIPVTVLDARVGRVDPAAAVAVANAVRTDGASLHGHRTGMPLGGATDPRRTWLEQLLPLCRALRQPEHPASAG